MRAKTMGAVAGSLVVVALAVVATVGTGCDGASCQEVERNYERNLRAEPGMAQLTEDGAPHLAMAMRLDLFNDLAGGVITTAVQQALNSSGTLSVQGQSIPYGLSSSGANLRFDASDACDACLRVRGDLDGQVSATLPMVGEQRTPLSGSIDWTVPLGVSRDDDGHVSLFLDTAEAVRMGAPALQGQLTGLSGTWAQPVTNALLSELATVVARQVPPVRLVGFEMPRLGIAGLELTPSLFHLDGSTNALVLGVRTNLPVSTGGDANAVRQALALQDGQNIALAIDPQAVVETVRAGMQQGRIARRYSLSGEARRDGSSHALVDRLQVGSHPQSRDALALGLDFRVFNFGSGFGCFSMDGLATSRLQVDGGRVALELEDVNFTGSRFADVANWGSAQFIDRAATVVTATLNESVVLTPEVGMNLRGDRVSAEAGMLVLRGQGRASR